jgi:hypothetical protein
VSRRTDGTFHCDRCDALLANDGIFSAVIAADLHPMRPGEMRQLHFCRVNGCSLTLLSPENLTAWLTAEGVLP